MSHDDKPRTVPAYVAALPIASQVVAESLREAVAQAVPQSTEAMKYGIMAFLRDGKPFLYVGLWKKHAALYPIYRGTAEFEKAVSPFRAAKDTVRFSLAEPIPLELIRTIAANQAVRR